jgi:hypothetical protein
MKRKRQQLEESYREVKLGKTSRVNDEDLNEGHNGENIEGAVETGSQREVVGQPFNNGLNEGGEDNDDPLRAAESTSAQDDSALEAVDEYNETREMVLFSREHRRVIRATNRKLAGIANKILKRNLMLTI